MVVPPPHHVYHHTPLSRRDETSSPLFCVHAEKRELVRGGEKPDVRGDDGVGKRHMRGQITLRLKKSDGGTILWWGTTYHHLTWPSYSIFTVTY
jgi:hypothetical protein